MPQRFRTPTPINRVPIEEWELLGKKVTGNRGRIIVLVHPTYARATPEYEKTIVDLLRQEQTPVVILQTQGNARDFVKWMKKMRLPQHLVLPTAYNKSDLVIEYPDGSNTYHEPVSESFATRLASLGVKTALIGGMYANAIRVNHDNGRTGLGNLPAVVKQREAEWLAERNNGASAAGNARLVRHAEGNPIAGGCAGSAYARLLETGLFKVRLIPKAVHPDKPAYFKAGAGRGK